MTTEQHGVAERLAGGVAAVVHLVVPLPLLLLPVEVEDAGEETNVEDVALVVDGEAVLGVEERLGAEAPDVDLDDGAGEAADWTDI